MSRYITRAAKPLYVETPLWEDTAHFEPNLTVDDEKIVDTGLVDLHGNCIMRLPPPVGFGRNEDW